MRGSVRRIKMFLHTCTTKHMIQKGHSAMDNPEKLATYDTEGAFGNGQSRETGKICYTRRTLTKQKHNTICVGNHYAQANTNNVNKT
jgi:hypothetical protein